jgi:hypothetical protein
MKPFLINILKIKKLHFKNIFEGGGGDMNGMNLRKPKWEQFDLVPFEKSFYNPHANLANASRAEVCQYLFSSI